MRHFRIVDERGGVIDEQAFRTSDEAHAWASTHPSAGLGTWILMHRVGGEWHELAGPDDE